MRLVVMGLLAVVIAFGLYWVTEPDPAPRPPVAADAPVENDEAEAVRQAEDQAPREAQAPAEVPVVAAPPTAEAEPVEAPAQVPVLALPPTEARPGDGPSKQPAGPASLQDEIRTLVNEATGDPPAGEGGE